MGRLKQFDPEVAVGTAMDVFWRQGYAGTSPVDLTQELGIGKGSLYNTFESKHSLFEQALQRYADERLARLTQALAGSGSTRRRLRAALERLASPEVAHLRRRGCLAVNTAAELGGRDAAATEIVRSTFERMEQALQAAIEEGQHVGEIAAERDARALAGLFLTTLLGLTVIARANDDVLQLQRAIDALMNLI